VEFGLEKEKKRSPSLSWQAPGRKLGRTGALQDADYFFSGQGGRRKPEKNYTPTPLNSSRAPAGRKETGRKIALPPTVKGGEFPLKCCSTKGASWARKNRKVAPQPAKKTKCLNFGLSPGGRRDESIRKQGARFQTSTLRALGTVDGARRCGTRSRKKKEEG